MHFDYYPPPTFLYLHRFWITLLDYTDRTHEMGEDVCRLLITPTECSPPTTLYSAPPAFEPSVRVLRSSSAMFSAITFLVAFSVLGACWARPMKLEIKQFKCAYSTDPYETSVDITKCPGSCEPYSDIALLKTPESFEVLLLFCIETSETLNHQRSIQYEKKLVH
ncbi:unnamed protein product [Nezara viridula]|uniref:Uncharacterized protein n=1 Tax=Nezara viridula TaxID=85310 RepID=A0A9P0HAZ0_NEZVI|nr:unnamed protein product [Nezara viridula]